MCAVRAQVQGVTTGFGEAGRPPAQAAGLQLVDHVQVEQQRKRIHLLVALPPVELGRPGNVLGTPLQPSRHALAVEFRQVRPGEPERRVGGEAGLDLGDEVGPQPEVAVELRHDVEGLAPLGRLDRPEEGLPLGGGGQTVALGGTGRSPQHPGPVVLGGEGLGDGDGVVGGAVVDEQQAVGEAGLRGH